MAITTDPTIQAIGVTGAAASAVIALLALKYNDRPLFYEHIKDIPHVKGIPLLGNLPIVLKNLPRFYDFTTENLENLDTLTL